MAQVSITNEKEIHNTQLSMTKFRHGKEKKRDFLQRGQTQVGPPCDKAF